MSWSIRCASVFNFGFVAAQDKFGMTSGMKIVLESDGTEVDEEEYFSTLEQNTCFMILKENEDWIPPSEYNYLLVN